MNYITKWQEKCWSMTEQIYLALEDELAKNIHSQHEPTNNNGKQCFDKLEQKLHVYSGRHRKYKASHSRKHICFLSKQKEFFYSMLKYTAENINKPYPNREQILVFWGSQFPTQASCNVNVSWANEQRHITNE